MRTLNIKEINGLKTYRVFSGKYPFYYKLKGIEDRQIEKGLKKFHFPSNSCIIEVGCGTGRWSNCLQVNNPESHVIGIDRNIKVINRAKMAFPEIEFINAEFPSQFESFLTQGDIFFSIRFINNFEPDDLQLFLPWIYLYPDKRFIFYFAHFDNTPEILDKRTLALYRPSRNIKKKVLRFLKSFFRIIDYHNGFYELKTKKNFLMEEL